MIQGAETGECPEEGIRWLKIAKKIAHGHKFAEFTLRPSGSLVILINRDHRGKLEETGILINKRMVDKLKSFLWQE